MKSIHIKLIVLFLMATSQWNTLVQAQEKFNFGKDQCHHCNMVINDPLHVAMAIDKEGKVYKFDAIEGLINFLKENNETIFSKLLVADYTNKGKLTDASTATFIKSEAIPSPMGAFLSAISDRSAAEKLLKAKGGKLYNWKQIKAKFENSKFGSLNHDHHDHFRPDAHAPIGIMGDHLHKQGDFMVSLRYMNMHMDGNKSGTNTIDVSEIHTNFIVAPLEMKMQMYMLGIMYAPTPKVTVMIMQNFVKKNMDLQTRMGMNFETSSNGVGDLGISALYGLFSSNNHSLLLNARVSLPIGSITSRDNTPMVENMKLPYAMQLGSGTFDITAGFTYKGNIKNFSWGLQQLNTFRTGENSEDYRFGNHYALNIWGAYRVSKTVSISLRTSGNKTNGLTGIDEELNPMMITTANTANYGNKKIKLYGGINIAFPEESTLSKFTIGAEAGAPVYEDYNGIQINDNLNLNFGIRYSIL